MFGQLRNNFRFLRDSTAISAFVLAGVCLTPHVANAADITGDQITASTTLPIWGGFTVDQIADGLGLEPDPPTPTGFTTNAKTGTINLRFDQAYDLESFKLWNDVVLRAEGIKTFRLDFKTAEGGLLSSQIFEAASREPDVQIFNFPKINDVTSVDLVVLSSLKEPGTATQLPTFAERIEVREVAFTGESSNARRKKIADMQDYIDGLMVTIKGHEDRIAELTDFLTKEKNRADSTFALLQDRDAEIVDLKKEITDLKAEIDLLKEGVNPSSPTMLQLILGSLAFLSLGGLAGFMMGRRGKPPSPKTPDTPQNQENRKLKPSFPVYVLKPQGDSFVVERKQYPQDMINYDAEKEELIIDSPMGLVFDNSKLVPAQGGVPSASTPINAAAAIDKAYHAVGRVGYAQEGPAIGDDESFGTAILIGEDRIMTNRHVFDRHHHLIPKNRPFGVEFFGEKDSDATEFYELTTDDVVFIKEYDAVILKLAKPVPNTNREPIKFTAKPPETFDEKDVLVIGYPAEPFHLSDEIIEAMGGDDVFGVKRYSEGKMFRHPQDNNPEYGVEAYLNGHLSEKGWLLAICHQASTLPGNSGSAILSKETGELIALHYGCDDFDRHETLKPHPANIAHSGMFLANSVTFITSGAFEQYLEQDNKSK